MNHLGFWEWLANSMVFVPAALIAARQEIKESRILLLQKIDEGIGRSPWKFAPLLAISIAGVILVWLQFGWIGTRKQDENVTVFPKWQTPPREKHGGRRFGKQRHRVPLL